MLPSDRISLDLDDLDDDLSQAANDFDLGIGQTLSPNGVGEIVGLSDPSEPPLTLESILNEEDDLENDEILKSLGESLTLMQKKSGGNNQANSNSLTPSNLSESRSSSFSGFVNHQSLADKNGIVCKQAPLKQISGQLIAAIERADAGLPTTLAVAQLFAVGTSRGLILLFDSAQILKLYITTEHKDAITALALNNKCDRLLVGNALGYIFMFDTNNGKCLRKITEAHPYGNSILHVKFTDDPTVACFSDSGGSVFMLEFKRTMGVRGADSTCIFSGSRGEVCHIEPLKFERFAQSIIDKLSSSSSQNQIANNTSRSSSVKRNLDNISQIFQKYSLLAMVSFTKIFVVTLRPKLTVLFTYPLHGSIKYLPIINWQFVIMQSNLTSSQNKANTDDSFVAQSKRFVTPILACARESAILFFQIDYYSKRDESKLLENQSPDGNKSSMSVSSDLEHQFKFILLKKSEYSFKIYNFCWLNAKTLAVLDHTEKLHICDIRSNEELQVISHLPECVQLVYNNSFFKSLSTGGYVSKALAYAGENACYQTFQAYLGQLFMLGSRSITIFSLQQWSSRIDDFVNDGNLDAALDLALAMYRGETKALIGLPIDPRLRREKIIDKIVDVLYLYVNRAMKQDCPSVGKLELLERHYRKCSSKCVHVCMSIGRHDILFDTIYSLLSCDKLFEGYFFESLEEHILSGSSRSGLNRNRTSATASTLAHHIPPVILRAFIDYYAAQPALHASLEKCLLHFDVSKIDLHSVMQMCRRHALWDAFIYLHNTAFKDYLTPFEELVKMMSPVEFLTLETAKHFLKSLDKERLSEITKCGNKLLVYLCCCLCGQAYPYGNLNDDQLSDRIRRSTFDYLTNKRSEMIDALISERLDEEEERRRERQENSENNKSAIMSVSSQHLAELADTQSSLGAYPIIKIFLHFDALDFLNVIAMAFNEPSFEAVIGLEKKQQLIDILIDIGLSRTAHSAASGSANNESSGQTYSVYNNRLVGHLFTFLARQIANKNNNIQVGNSIFTQIIEYLCNREEVDRMEEREQTLLSLLNSFSLQIMDYIDLDRLLSMASRAKFQRTCELLYELRGEYYEIVDCYLSPDNPPERQRQVFDVVRTIMGVLYDNAESTGSRRSSSRHPSDNSRMRTFTAVQQQHQQLRRGSSVAIEPRETQVKKLVDKLLRRDTIAQMLAMNPTETIHLLWIEMNIDLKQLIRTINGFRTTTPKTKANRQSDVDEIDEITAQSKSSPSNNSLLSSSFDDNKSDGADEGRNDGSGKRTTLRQESGGELLYKFVKGLFDLVELIKTDRKYLNYMSQFGGEYCELYVELICEFEPDSLIYVFKSVLNEYNFRLDECLRICREREHWDGAAYLLEKSGQVEAAFMLNLEKMSALIKLLQKRLELLSQNELDVLKSKIDAHLVMIVQLCQRNSCSLSDQVREKIWFSLFDEVMRPIRALMIDPNIEAALLSSGGAAEIEDESDRIVRERLNETREFFKSLGSYIINSMVGYLNLTTIIDRMICDPLYGASNFGDIKDLMLKMLEMCSYEQTLLEKTSSLVSRDVHSKMIVYKRLAAKSFSSFTNFCQYCSRPLDLNAKSNGSSFETASITSSMSGGNQQQKQQQRMLLSSLNNNISSPSVDLGGGESSLAASSSRLVELDSRMAISIYSCGHSFHLSCLEILQPSSTSPVSQTSVYSMLCPVCNSSSSYNQQGLQQPSQASSAAAKLKSKYAKKKQQQMPTSMSTGDLKEMSNGDSEPLSLQNFTDDMATKKPKMVTSNQAATTSADANQRQIDDLESQQQQQQQQSLSFALSDRQMSALKSIRTRNLSIFDIDSSISMANKTSATNSGSSTNRFMLKSTTMPSIYEQSANSRAFNTMLEKQSKLVLAPANLTKFI